MYIKNKVITISVLISSLLISFFNAQSQGSGKLDAVYIAKEYSNSIVKILLFDSIAEKKVPGSGYLGRGSGFIVAKDGIVFTNRHVIEYCMEYMEYSYFSPSDKKIYKETNKYNTNYLNDPEFLSIEYVRRATPIIQVYNGKYENDFKLYRAKLIAVDTKNFDGAILKIVSDMEGNPVDEEFNPIPLGNSDQTSQGEDMCVFGFPAQYENAGFDLMLKDQSTLTFGKHSGFDYVFNPYYGYIKTDASVNSGNSGGPVFNSSNKAIGIATASGNKTNIGLIGGINAMHNLASIQKKILESYKIIYFTHTGLISNVSKIEKGRLSSLLDELTEKGLVAPHRSPSKSTSLLFSQQPIPTVKTVNNSNIKKKNIRSFYGPKDYFKFTSSLSQKDNFTINKDPDLQSTSIILTPNEKIEAITLSEVGIEYGHLFTLKRLSPVSKISLDWSYSINFGARDWSNAKIYYDTFNSIITFYSDAIFFRFGNRIGVNYSYLLNGRFPVDFYYKFTTAYEDGSQIGSFDNTQYNLQYADENELRYSGAAFINSFGINFRRNFYFIGLEYSSGKTSIEYKLPYVNSWTQFDGTQDVTMYSSNNAKISGNNKFNSIKLTLGFMFGGNKKWKKKLIKEYNSK